MVCVNESNLWEREERIIFQAVKQQSRVDLPARRAMLFTVSLKRRDLIFVHRAGFQQQPANQRALAVIDASTGDEAQKFLAGVFREQLLAR